MTPVAFLHFKADRVRGDFLRAPRCPNRGVRGCHTFTSARTPCHHSMTCGAREARLTGFCSATPSSGQSCRGIRIILPRVVRGCAVYAFCLPCCVGTYEHTTGTTTTDDRTYRGDAAGNNIRTDSSYTKMAGLRTLCAALAALCSAWALAITRFGVVAFLGVRRVLDHRRGRRAAHPSHIKA